MNLSANKYKLPELHIGNKLARLPIIQGGMGVGVSLSSLAGAVAKEGGVGIISTAQIGYDDDAFEYDQAGCNLAAIKKHIQKAKEIAGGNGLVGVNIMVALKHYKEHVKAAVAAGADVIISGAGLPIDLPALVDKACQTKIAPIVSSKRATQLILKMWSHKYDRTADFIVIEGPKAGGHLGFSNEQLNNTASLDFDNEITNIIECKKEYEDKYSKKIPVIVAGGIFDKQDILHTGSSPKTHHFLQYSRYPRFRQEQFPNVRLSQSSAAAPFWINRFRRPSECTSTSRPWSIRPP